MGSWGEQTKYHLQKELLKNVAYKHTIVVMETHEEKQIMPFRGKCIELKKYNSSQKYDFITVIHEWLPVFSAICGLYILFMFMSQLIYVYKCIMYIYIYYNVC